MLTVDTAERVPVLESTLSMEPREAVASSYDSFALTAAAFGRTPSHIPAAARTRTMGAMEKWGIVGFCGQ